MSDSGALLALVPAALAVLLLALAPGRERLRRRGLLGAIALGSAAAGAALLFYPARPLSGPAVLILDSAKLFEPGDGDLAALAARYESAGMSECDVVLIDGAASTDGVCRIPTGLGARTWSKPSQCGRMRPEDALRAHDPDCALQLAAARLQARGRLSGILAALRASSRRIAAVVSQPRQWAQTWRIDSRQRLAELAAAGISLDLVRLGAEAIEDETATLSIEVSPPRFPERQVNGQIELRVSSPQLDSLVGQVVTGTTRCTLDLQPGSGFEVTRTSDPYVVRSTGIASRQAPLRLEEFKGLNPGQSPYAIVRGFHLLDCTVSLSLPGQSKQLPSRAAQYLDVGPRYFTVIAGQAGAFAADGVSTTRLSDVEELWGAVTSARRWHGDLAMGPVRPEASFRASGLPPGSAPSVLVLHDLSKETWAKRCGDLSRLVASGTTLLVSGAPLRSQAPECDFLPAFARPSGPTASTQVDRRPRVTFLLDPSRLGALHHRPQRDTRPAEPYAAIPASQYGAPSSLANGLEVQRAAVDSACEGLRALDSSVQCGELESSAGPRRGFVAARRRPAAPYDAKLVGASTEAELAAASQLSARLAPLISESPGPGTVLANDVLVLFTYDVAQIDAASPLLGLLLDRGVLIEVVVLASPYAPAAVAPLASVPLDAAFANGSNKAREKLRDTDPAAALLDRHAVAERLRTNAAWNVDLAAADPLAAARKVGETLAADLRQRLAPDASLFAVHRRGRFVDEHLGPWLPEGLAPRWRARPPEAFAAPLRFQPLEQNDDVDSARWLSAVQAPEIGEGAHSPTPLAFAGVHGRGEVIVLGYSLFEGLAGTFFPDAPWRSRPSSRVVVAGSPPGSDAFGPQRLVDVVRYQSPLSLGPGETPRIVAARVANASGRIELDVLQRLRGGAAVDRIELKGCRSGGFSGTCDSLPGAKAMPGRVVDLDAGSQRLTYTFAANELASVCGGERGCVATLRMDDGKTPDDELRLFVNGIPGSAAGAAADLEVVESLRALAHYSGGAEVLAGEQPSAPKAPVRSLAVQGLLLLSLAYWAARLLQRVGTVRTLRLESRRQANAALPIDARGAVRSAGEALGSPQSTLRVGAFAGFRPFAAGDRLSAAVREDVVLYAQARSRGEPARIPRVARHIDELGRHVRLLVNVGMSMRTPGAFRSTAAKLRAAAGTCELLAEVGWQFRSTVEIIPLGLREPGEVFGPAASPSASGAVSRHVLGQGGLPATWRPRPQLPDQDFPMSVVLVSDFLNEDLRQLQRFAAGIEEEGGLFGAVQVHSPDELLLLGAGVAPSFDVLCDRTGWSALDSRLAHEQFRTELDLALGGYAGGLLSVSGELSATEILGLLAEAPLLRLLR